MPIVRNEPHSGGPGETGPAGRRLIVRNKTQSGATGLAPGERLCKTKPIPGGAGWDGAIPKPMAQNEPNFARAPGNGRGRLGPLAPCRDRFCKTKPNLGGMGHLGDGASGGPGSPSTKRAKQAQFRLSAKAPRAKCAKRTQFPAGSGGTRRGGQQAIVPNKPNLGHPLMPGGAIAQNEPNFRVPTPAMTGRLTVSSYL